MFWLRNISQKIKKTAFCRIPLRKRKNCVFEKRKLFLEKRKHFWRKKLRKKNSQKNSEKIRKKTQKKQKKIRKKTQKKTQKKLLKKADKVNQYTLTLKSNYQQELDALDELKKSILEKACNGAL